MLSRRLGKIARKNGAQAAGIKSSEGIKKSAMSAFRHRLTGKALVLANESEDELEALLQLPTNMREITKRTQSRSGRTRNRANNHSGNYTVFLKPGGSLPGKYL